MLQGTIRGDGSALGLFESRHVLRSGAPCSSRLALILVSILGRGSQSTQLKSVLGAHQNTAGRHIWQRRLLEYSSYSRSSTIQYKQGNNGSNIKHHSRNFKNDQRRKTKGKKAKTPHTTHEGLRRTGLDSFLGTQLKPSAYARKSQDFPQRSTPFPSTLHAWREHPACVE